MLSTTTLTETDIPSAVTALNAIAATAAAAAAAVVNLPELKSLHPSPVSFSL